MSEAYETALRVRDELRQRLEKVDKYIELHEWITGQGTLTTTTVLGAALQDSDPVLRAPIPEVTSESPSPSVPHAKPADVQDAAMSILEENQRPMTRGELLGEMEKRGMVIGGTDKSKTLGTTLWRARNRITNISGHGYWIKSQPYPALGYVPSTGPRPAEPSADDIEEAI